MQLTRMKTTTTSANRPAERKPAPPATKPDQRPVAVPVRAAEAPEPSRDRNLRVCGDCRYQSEARCHRNPPAVWFPNVACVGVWPAVRLDGVGCGEFREKEGGK